MTDLAPSRAYKGGMIVVGHDNSSRSAAALDLAFTLAQTLGTDVLVIDAWALDTVAQSYSVQHGRVAISE